jgi:hypothetical protein
VPDFRVSKSITALNLSGCSDIPPQVFTTILPQLPKLRILDAADTHITTEALSLIPSTARLTHINLSNCAFLSGSDLIKFLHSHPAVTTTLEFLSIDALTETPILSEEDVTSILAHASPTLRCLHLKNSNMSTTHIPNLRRLVGQLEELTVGSHLSMQDLEAIFLSPEQISEAGELQEEAPVESESKYDTMLDPMETAVAICKVRRRINSISSSSSGKGSKGDSRLRALDISSMSTVEQGKIRMSVLLGSQSGVLERIEIAEKVVGRMAVLKRVVKAVGWELMNVGRRCWVGRKMKLCR